MTICDFKKLTVLKGEMSPPQGHLPLHGLYNKGEPSMKGSKILLLKVFLPTKLCGHSTVDVLVTHTQALLSSPPSPSEIVSPDSV